MGIISIFTLLFAVPVSYMGYYTFGDEIKSVIIYNLPAGDTLSTVAKMLYVFTICGSYVIIISPIFYILENT